MRNALNPVLTAITGWFASLLAGAVFVEYVFDWKGIGLVIVDALEKYDLPVIMGVVLFIAVILILAELILFLPVYFLFQRFHQGFQMKTVLGLFVECYLVADRINYGATQRLTAVVYFPFLRPVILNG